jgi:hypothetical protein
MIHRRMMWNILWIMNWKGSRKKLSYSNLRIRMLLENKRESNYNNPWFKPRFEPRTSTIRTRNVSFSTAMLTCDSCGLGFLEATSKYIFLAWCLLTAGTWCAAHHLSDSEPHSSLSCVCSMYSSSAFRTQNTHFLSPYSYNYRRS